MNHTSLPELRQQAEEARRGHRWQAGMDDYHSKPIRADELVAALSSSQSLVQRI
jgi:DNA-binding response OmpR family regulator